MTAWGVTDSRLIGAPPLLGQGLSDQSDILKAAELIWYNSFIHFNIVAPFENWIHEVLKPIWLEQAFPRRRRSQRKIRCRDIPSAKEYVHR